MAYQRPSAAKMIELMSGPSVKVTIGSYFTRPEWQVYTVSRKLLYVSFYLILQSVVGSRVLATRNLTSEFCTNVLVSCYHSEYCRRHFSEKKEIKVKSGTFSSTKIKLVDNDEIKLFCSREQFDLLLESMFHGTITKRWSNSRETIDTCMALLEYANKIDMEGVVCEAIVEPVRDAIKNPAIPTLLIPDRTGIPQLIIPAASFTTAQIKVMFSATTPGHPLRVLIAQEVLSREGLKGETFKDAEINVPGFGLEVFNQFRECASFWIWKDPISGAQRTFDER